MRVDLIRQPLVFRKIQFGHVTVNQFNSRRFIDEFRNKEFLPLPINYSGIDDKIEGVCFEKRAQYSESKNAVTDVEIIFFEFA